MSAWNGVYEDHREGEICSECGEEFDWIDEATELCETCFEHIFGHPMPEERP